MLNQTPHIILFRLLLTQPSFSRHTNVASPSLCPLIPNYCLSFLTPLHSLRSECRTFLPSFSCRHGKHKNTGRTDKNALISATGSLVEGSYAFSCACSGTPKSDQTPRVREARNASATNDRTRAGRRWVAAPWLRQLVAPNGGSVKPRENGFCPGGRHWPITPGNRFSGDPRKGLGTVWVYLQERQKTTAQVGLSGFVGKERVATPKLNSLQWWPL